YYTNIFSIDTNAELYSSIDNIHQTINLALNDFTNVLEDLHIYLANPMSVEEFFSISAKDVVYEIFKDDQVIEKLIKTFRPVDLTCDNSKNNNSVEIPLISINIAIASLETVYMCLLQQDKAN
ncbi:7529_t:CDS:1, partial [Dentiscutata erythropus]